MERDWQVVFVAKLRDRCVGVRKPYLNLCWEMGGLNLDSNILLLCSVENTSPSEQLKELQSA